jgi:hypothetical protein
MFKLTPAIRNRFVLVPYIEAKAPSSKSPRQTLVPRAQRPALQPKPSSAAVRLLAGALAPRLTADEIEAMVGWVREPHWSSSPFSSATNSALASLARLAPAVCSQIRSMNH